MIEETGRFFNAQKCKLKSNEFLGQHLCDAPTKNESIIRRLEKLEKSLQLYEGLYKEINGLKISEIPQTKSDKSGELKLQMEELKTIVRRQNTKLGELKSELRELQTTVKSQSDEISKQNKIINALCERFTYNNGNDEKISTKGLSNFQNDRTPSKEGFEKKNNVLNVTSVHNLPLNIDRATTNMSLTENQSHEDYNLKTSRTSFKDTRNERKRQTDTKVMFEALLDGEFTDLAPEYILKMHNVVTNEGNGYNHSNGVFAAMVTGVYMFHCRVTPVLGKEAYIQLMINGNGRGVLHASSTTVFQTTSGTFFANLTIGDHVWMETVWFTSSLLGGYNAFSGILLY